MKQDWQSFKENIQRGNSIRKEIAELDLLVPRKPEVVQCKTATVHYHQNDSTGSWVLALVILLCLLILLLIMLAQKVSADAFLISRESSNTDSAPHANGALLSARFSGVNGESQSSEISSGNIENGLIRHPRSEDFHCNARELINYWYTGIGDCL